MVHYSHTFGKHHLNAAEFGCALYCPDMDKDPTQIGQNIKGLRQGRNLTQQALAERLGVGLSTIKQIESGLKVKAWPKVAQMAEALGATPNDLFGASDGITPEKLGEALEPLLEAAGIDAGVAEDFARIALRAILETEAVSEQHEQAGRYRFASRILAQQLPALAGL